MVVANNEIDETKNAGKSVTISMAMPLGVTISTHGYLQLVT